MTIKKMREVKGFRADFDRVTAERDAALGREAALREELNISMLGHKNTTDAGARAMADRDALQQRLTAADVRADRLETGLKWESDRNALLLASLTEAEDMLSVTSLEAGQRIEVLEGLLREWIGPGVRSVSHMLSLQTRTNAALKPAEGGSDEAMSFAQIAQFNDDNDHCPEREE